MMKKTIFFMLCLAPLGVQAAPFTGGVIGITGGGNGNNQNGYIANEGINVSAMNIGVDIPSPLEPNTLYAGTNIIRDNFTITSYADITGGALYISDGYSLNLQNTQNNNINMSFTSINADGRLTVRDADLFKVDGSIAAANGLSVTAETMQTGAINVTGGDTVLDVAGALTMGGFHNSGNGTTQISADTSIGVAGGDIENTDGAGNMTITTGGTLTAGNIYNSSGTMNITAGGDITVSGTVKNDSATSNMVLNADNLTVSGGNTNEASFVNSGNLTINVTGTTNLEYGFDISAMGIDNTFSLTTGTLTFGSGANTDRWLNVFSNKLNQFTLNITNDSLNIAADVINGLINSDTQQYNENANMTITAQAITADSVTNRGNKLVMTATEIDGDGIVISGGVEGFEGADTDIHSAAVLQVQGDVSNRGTMSLNGTRVELANVSNDGGELDITSLTNDIGEINISGNVTNVSGNTLINAKDIVIGGTLSNQAGSTIIDGSDTDGSDLKIGAIDVSGGVVDLTALIGGVNVDGAINVTGDGAMNIDGSTHSLTAGQTIQINGDMTLSDVAASGNGNVNIAATGSQGFVMTSTNGNINIDGSVLATSAGSRSATFVANIIKIGESVTASGANNKLVFGGSASNQLTVAGDMSATGGATIEIVSDDANVGSLNVGAGSTLVARGTQITATKGAIDIADGLWFGATGLTDKPDNGLIVEADTTNLTLKSDTAQVEIGGALDLGTGRTLVLSAENSAVTVGGAVLTAGTLNANAQNITLGDVTNSGTATLTADQRVVMGNVMSNSGTLNITANGTGLPNIQMGGLNIANGAFVNIDSDATANVAATNVVVTGDVSQGTQAGALNLLATDTTFAAESLTITGNYDATAGSALFEVAGPITVGGNITVATDAELNMGGDGITATNLDNNGTLALHSDNGITLAQVTNTGNLTLDSGAGVTTVDTFAVGDAGTITLMGAGLTTDGVFTTQNTVLYQNYLGTLSAGEVNVDSDDYTITASEFNVAGVNQVSGRMQINASDINVAGDVTALDLRFAKNPASPDSWIDATIDGNVSGGVDFWGLKRLDIKGTYTFNNDSDLWAAIMPYDEEGTGNTSKQNYWSTVEVTGDNKVGEITNAAGGAAMITVGEKFVSNVSGVVNGSAASQPQVGITLFDTVDTGTAIWLLHAEKGIDVSDGFDKLRNLDVKFCNGDGSICIDYADTLRPSDAFNGTDSDLPIYLSERDTDGDGVADSLYIVFDPRFGGPVEVFKIQPIVAEVADHTTGEYVSAGALDNLIAGQLLNTKFYNDTPIELIPEIFRGTNFATMANELYDRMEYYNMTGERDPLARFSRLFQARELEQIAGNISLNEHTNFRDFEDRMFDEFIWNRNRNLKKAWLDVDYGMFSQDVSDGKRAKGNRFSIAGGFDWQDSETLILGLTARVSNSSSDNSDAVELGYLPGQSLLGTVDVTVDDLNIGLGGYLMKILGEKTRLYGNAFLDIHLLDTARDQTFMSHIDGSGSAFSFISEWGLLHDWLNQYIVGNAYARVGYNFGFDVTEHAAGQDYMDMQSDGYLILTPGYSLIAQKRIYPSAWFQIRPYASIGVEYDVLGAPDFVKYKFAPAHTYTKYDVDIDPLWANIGGGVEFLSAVGLQFGIDYRYQYNDAIQLHNIKVTGSYRF